MALTTERIRELWENYSPTKGIESFARSVEAEARNQDDALILQLVEALEASLPEIRGLGLLSPTAAEHADKHAAAIKAGRARLEGKP